MHPRLAAAKQADALTALQEQLPVMREELAALKVMSEAQQAQLDRIEALLKRATDTPVAYEAAPAPVGDEPAEKPAPVGDEPEPEAAPAPVGLEKPTSKKK
jgi:hypothetical protein